MGIQQQHKSFFLINILVHLCDISNLNYQQVKPRNFQSGMLMNAGIEIKPNFPLARGMSSPEKLLVPKKNH